jgi:hypothetical protein
VSGPVGEAGKQVGELPGINGALRPPRSTVGGVIVALDREV